MGWEGPVATLLEVPPFGGHSRPRLLRLCGDPASRRLTAIVGPAGSGKSTLARELAEIRRASGSWCPQLPNDSLSAGIADVVDASLDLMSSATPPSGVVLFVDDLHAAPSDAVEALEKLLDRGAPWMSVVVASRGTPDMCLSTRRLEESALIIGTDDLRWRPWEITELFRRHFRRSLPPDLAAELATRTEGWIAGLKLFELLWSERSNARAHELLEELHARPGVVFDYLARNVAASLDADLRAFLVDTSVLGVLTAALCDELRGADDSDRHLETLRRRELFVVPRVDGGGLRYHEVFRSHLDHLLHETRGRETAREWHARAARLQEGHGFLSDAVGSFVRAEQWSDVGRLSGHPAARSSRPGTSAIPDHVVRSNAWLMVARAREAARDGRLEGALAVYDEAIASVGADASARSVATTERGLVARWLDGRTHPPGRRSADLLRRATQVDPIGVSEQLTARRGHGMALAALSAWYAGDAQRVRALARKVRALRDVTPSSIVLARAVEATAGWWYGLAPDQDAAHEAADEASRCGMGWISRATRALAMFGDDTFQLEVDLLLSDLPPEDRWSNAFLLLAGGIAGFQRGETSVDLLDRATQAFEQLGARILGAWAQAWRARSLVAARNSDAEAAAAQARALAHRVRAPGPELISQLAVLDAYPSPRVSIREALREQAARLGVEDVVAGPSDLRAVGIAANTPTGSVPRGRTEPSSMLRLFGSLQLRIGDHHLDPSRLRPQAREVLSLLAMYRGQMVSLHDLVRCVWGRDADNGSSRRLQVLISHIRHELDCQLGLDARRALRREPGGYILDLVVDDDDRRRFDRARVDVHRAEARGHAAQLLQPLREQVAIHQQPLLPAVTRSWVEEPRDRYRTAAWRASGRLVRHHLDTGGVELALEYALRQTEIDPSRRRGWLMLAATYDRLGEPGHASLARGRAAGLEPAGPASKPVTIVSGTRSL